MRRYRITIELEADASTAEAYFERVSTDLREDVDADASTLYQALDENGEPLFTDGAFEDE